MSEQLAMVNSPSTSWQKTLLKLLEKSSIVLVFLAIGVMIVIISGGIDISVGTVMSLSMVMMGVAVIDGGVPLVVGFLIAVFTGACMGSINGFLLLRQIATLYCNAGYVGHCSRPGINHQQWTLHVWFSGII